LGDSLPSNALQRPVKTLQLAIDGSKAPEMVPEALAYRHLLSSTFLRRGADPGTIVRLQARLKRVGLDEDDLEVYFLVAGQARRRLDDIEAQRAKWSGTNAGTVAARAALVTLRTQEVQIFEDAAAQLKASLSPLGTHTLETYLREHVRRQIKIYSENPSQQEE
jgi:hypothetical protein